jgi:hypothetical protein
VRGNPPDTVHDGASFNVDVTQWRTYTCRWEADQIIFYLDGTEIRRVTGITVRQPLSLGPQAWVAAPGDAWYGGPPDDFSAKRIQIAYVRILQIPVEQPPPSNVAITINVGSGADKLALRVTQDPFEGSAQYTVSVDGAQIGGTLTAVAVRGSGFEDLVNVFGNWATGAHTATVNFLNDITPGTEQPPPPPPPPPPPDPNAATIDVGTGPDLLVLKVSQDPYQGSAQYTVSVDSVQIGGTLTAVAVRANGFQDTINVRGSWSSGTHTVTVNYLNDFSV